LSASTIIALGGVVVSLVAFVISLRTYQLNRRLQPLTTATKLMDRVLEINKLMLQYPDVMLAFLRESQRTEPYFSAPEEQVKRDSDYVKLKAFTYYLLDFNEEIYLVLQDKSISDQVQGKVWIDFIIKRMRHPLLRELFGQEGEHTYRGKFADFIEKNKDEINKPYDLEVW